ncbi:MAG: outer membrane protein assembly factor BamB [Pseudomonadales bacterium]|nr:outer membrane protein assembly factor BamB [Pseudomonadales bacterium]
MFVSFFQPERLLSTLSLVIPKVVTKAGMLIVIVLMLGACSDDDVLPPSPLPDFDEEIQVEELWSVDVEDGVDDNYLLLTPAITERWVYAASYGGEVVKLNREDGEEVWEIETEHKITGGVGAGYGVVVYGTDNGEAVALSEEDGSEIWKVELSGQILATPAVGASRVVVQTMDGQLHALNRETGKKEWLYDTPIPNLTLRGSSSPIIVGEVTLAGFANGRLVAIKTDNGSVGWEYPVSEPQGRSELERLVDLDGRFWVERNVVYAATYQGKLAAIDIPSGRLLWQKPFSTYAGVSEKLDRVYVVGQDSVIKVLDAVSGAEVWTTDLFKGRRLSAITPVGVNAVVGDFEGYLHWLHYRDGRIQARVRVDRDGLRAPPIVKDNVVYVQGNSGELAAYKVIEK